MKKKISIELIKHRLEQSKEDLESAEILFDNEKFKSANNRAYYSIFHSMKAVLGFEGEDFKKHKDVIAYFNKNYIKTEIFPRKLGRKISEASTLREDSDYDDEFIADKEETYNQIELAKELYNLCEEYILNKIYELSQNNSQNQNVKKSNSEEDDEEEDR